MSYYRAWSDPKDGSITLALADELRPSVVGPDATILYEFEAATWEEAMAIHHLRQGWEPYRPAGEPAPCPTPGLRINGKEPARPTCGAWYWPEGSGKCWHCGVDHG
mgnify:CR=1 FL=1